MSGGTPATTALDKAKISYTTHPYAHDARAESYGEEAAEQLGVDARQIFKTLIAAVDSGLVCAVVPVAGRLDLKALAAAVGGRKAELAEPAKAQRATGYVLGGISPLGHRSRYRWSSTPRRSGSTPCTSRPANGACSWPWRRPTWWPLRRPRWPKSPPADLIA